MLNRAEKIITRLAYNIVIYPQLVSHLAYLSGLCSNDTIMYSHALLIICEHRRSPFNFFTVIMLGLYFVEDWPLVVKI